MTAKVLFVDDEPAVLESVRRMLRKEPYEILTAGSGAEARVVLAGGPIDVIVSDERMPGESGSDLLSYVRQTYPATMRIMLTGETGLTAAVHAINDNLYRFLDKPLSPTELVRVVRGALQIKEMSELQTSLRLRVARYPAGR